MSKTIQTTHDGWKCVPELYKALEYIHSMNHYVYEIENCVRSSNLEDMVRDMISEMTCFISVLNQIDTNREFVTVEEDGEQ